MAYSDSMAECLLCAGTMFPAEERPVGAKWGAFAEEIVPVVMITDSSDRLKDEQEPLMGGGLWGVTEEAWLPFLARRQDRNKEWDPEQDRGHSVPEPAFQPGCG